MFKCVLSDLCFFKPFNVSIFVYVTVGTTKIGHDAFDLFVHLLIYLLIFNSTNII